MLCSEQGRQRVRRLARRILRGGIIGGACLAGCAGPQAAVHYLGDTNNQFYKAVATEIDHPAILTESPDSVAFTEPPKTIEDESPTDVWDIRLADAIQIALAQSEIIRTNGTFLNGGGTLLTNPNNAPSVFDSAIQETSIQLGQGGVESALAAFDANFATSMFWSRDESFSNFGALFPSTTEAGNFNATLSKVFGTGASLALGHSVNYAGIAGGFGAGGGGGGATPLSTYTGNTALQFRQPLLAGSGTEFTRVAGPLASPTSQLSGVTNGFLGGGGGAAGGFGQQLAGVSNGVVIARINNDITLTQFEASVRDMIRDVEDVYWDLYLAYRNFDTAVIQRNSSLQTWRVAKIRRELEADILPADEAQARDQYFASVALVDTARSQVFEVETRLRRLLNLPVADGRVLRPADEPVTASVMHDWYACLSEALTERPELRNQKWNVKSLQLQLKAADSLVRPSLDFVAGYQINGVGDQLLGYDNAGPLGSINGPTFYESQTDGDLTSWQLGLTLTTPLGLRRAHSQARNIELRLAKAQKALATAEHEVSQELANAFQQLSRTRANMQSQYSRREAAIENVALLEPLLEEGQITLDELLRAQARRATADNDFFAAVVDYNKALANLQYRKGTLLEYDNITLTEGPWTPDAHYWANRRSDERAHARPARRTLASPPPFASNFNVDPVGFANEPTTSVEMQPSDNQATEPTPAWSPVDVPPIPSAQMKHRQGPTFAPGMPGNASPFADRFEPATARVTLPESNVNSAEELLRRGTNAGVEPSPFADDRGMIVPASGVSPSSEPIIRSSFEWASGDEIVR